MSLSLAALCDALGIPCPPPKAGLVLATIRPLQDATPDDLSFLENPAYRAAAQATRAAAVLVRAEDAALLPEGCLPLVTPAPYMAFAKALALFHPTPAVTPGISPLASLAPTATVAPTARIDAFAVLEDGVVVAEGAHIGPHVVLGKGVRVGQNSRIGAHCTLQKTTVGDNALFHPGVCTGQDGFGFAAAGGQIVKIPQVGGVIIGNDVEIGANTTIDCGALGDTVIEDMVKIDNQVQIGHNVRIGRATRVVAQVGVAGSTSVGQFVVIGGQTGIAGHLHIADKVMMAACTGVSKSISAVGQVVAGSPAVPIAEWRTGVALLARMARAARHKHTPKEGTPS